MALELNEKCKKSKFFDYTLYYINFLNIHFYFRRIQVLKDTLKVIVMQSPVLISIPT